MKAISLKKNIIGTFILLACTVLGGCNTMEGVGTDIKQGGAALERTADRNKPKT
jgi:predicted small secreted protein